MLNNNLNQQPAITRPPLWHIRITGALALLQFLLIGGVVHALMYQSQHARLAIVISLIENIVPYLFILAFAVTVGWLLLYWNGSKLMFWSLAAFVLIATIANIAILLDPIHGAIPTRNTFLYNVFIFPFFQRVSFVYTVLLSTCFLYLGLQLRLMRTLLSRVWPIILFSTAGWDLCSNLLLQHLLNSYNTAPSIHMILMGEISRLGYVVLACLLLGSLSISWKEKHEAETSPHRDGSLILVVVGLLLYLSALGTGYFSPYVLLVFRAYRISLLLPFLAVIIGMGLPVIAILLIQRRNSLVHALLPGKTLLGSWFLYALCVLFALRPVLRVLLPVLFHRSCGNHSLWLFIFGLV